MDWSKAFDQFSIACELNMMINAISSSMSALLPWSPLRVKWLRASPLYLRTDLSFHIFKYTHFSNIYIKQLLNDICTWYHELSKPRVCYLLGPTDLGFDNSQCHAQPHPINVAYYAEVKKNFNAGKYYRYALKNKRDWLLLVVLNKLLYIMVMVAINSVQLLCRRTCETQSTSLSPAVATLHHWDWRGWLQCISSIFCMINCKCRSTT